MPKVILIFPELYDMNLVSKSSARCNFAPPLGILTLAGVLLENGIKVSIIDQRIEPSWRETLNKEVQEKPLFVGISTLTSMQIRRGLEIAGFIKTHWDIPIVWGGVHPTLEPVSTAKHK